MLEDSRKNQEINSGKSGKGKDNHIVFPKDYKHSEVVYPSNASSSDSLCVFTHLPLQLATTWPSYNAVSNSKGFCMFWCTCNGPLGSTWQRCTTPAVAHSGGCWKWWHCLGGALMTQRKPESILTACWIDSWGMAWVLMRLCSGSGMVLWELKAYLVLFNTSLSIMAWLEIY